MEISEALSYLHYKIREHNLDIEGMDDEDLIVRALLYLAEDVELEFNEIEEEEVEDE